MRRRAETEDSEKAGRVYARDVENAWDPCILTLDGGGIRGYSSLLILKALMHEVWVWEQELDRQERREESGLLTTSPVDDNARSSRARYSTTHDITQDDNNDHTTEAPGVAITDASTSTAPHDLLKTDNITTEDTVRKAISEEELMPCHYFDFMYGTSTGGLIATLLGRLRMTVSEGLELYRKVGNDLFGRKRSNIPLVTKYHHEPYVSSFFLI